jgi:hypothetical protein
MRRTYLLHLPVVQCLAIAALLASPFGIRAQSAVASTDYGIKAGSGDAAFNVGWSNLPTKLDPSDTNSHPSFGGSGGVNLSKNLAAVGEYNYQLMNALDGVGFNTQFFGGAVRLSFGGSRVVPYLVAGGGGARLTGSESGVSVSSNGGYVSTGGGASIFLGRSWGIRPEFRYNYLHLTFAGITQNSNIAQVSTGFFFQFGGRTPNKQRVNPQQ